MHIYCKSHIKPYLNIIKTSNSYIWIEISKSLFYNINENILACTIYAQPKTSTYYTDEIWNELEIDLLSLTTNESPFFIIGDMNGRVGEWSEFSQLDKNVNTNYNITRSIAETIRGGGGGGGSFKYQRFTMEYKVEFNAAIRGHHIYKAN